MAPQSRFPAETCSYIEEKLDTLLLKVTITPLLMLLVSSIARRWGNFVGGIVAGLPVTSGPISIYLALDQGNHFAAQAAIGSLNGLGAVVISYSAYLYFSRHIHIFYCCTLTLLTYVLISIVLIDLDAVFLSILIIFIINFYFIFAASNTDSSTVLNVRRPRWDMLARMISSVALVLGVTGFASYLGPTLSGFLAPIPFVAWPLIVFTHIQGGSRAAASTICGTSVGALSVVAFNCAVAYFLQHAGIPFTYFIAFVFSIAMSVALTTSIRWVGAKTFLRRKE